MNRFGPILIVLVVLVILGLVCSNSVLSTGATTNSALTTMANINMSEAMKGMSEAMIGQSEAIQTQAFGLNAAILVLGLVAVLTAIFGYKIISKIQAAMTMLQAGNRFDSGGAPRYLTLAQGDAERFIRRLNYEQKLALASRLEALLSILWADVGYQQGETHALVPSRKNSNELRW